MILISKIIGADNRITLGDLSKLGQIYKIKIGNKSYGTILLKVENLKAFGIDLNIVFANCPYNKSYGTRDGFIINIDLYQHIALMRAIHEKAPKLKIGLFNYRAAKIASDVLRETPIYKESFTDWDWFWTGEKFLKHVYWNEKAYPEPALVFENELNYIDYQDFIMYCFGSIEAVAHKPGLHNPDGVAILGAEIKN